MPEILGHPLAWTGRGGGRVMQEVGMGWVSKETPCCGHCPPLGWAYCSLPALPYHACHSFALLSRKHRYRNSSFGSLAMSVGMERALKAPELGKVSACRAEPSDCFLDFLSAGLCGAKDYISQRPLGKGWPRGSVLTNEVRAKKLTSGPFE